MIPLRIFRFVLLLTTTVVAQTTHHNNDLYIPREKQPNFETVGQTYKVSAGSDIILPCKIAPAESYVLVWKRGIAVLAAGSLKITPDPRVTIVPLSPTENNNSASFNLELKDVRPHDAGDYVCQVGTLDPKEIVHTLEILVPPYISYISHKDPLEVAQGATVKLECRGSGNPVPKVVWTKKNGNLPSGERTIETPVLLLPNVNRHTAGNYECLAQNGVGEPAKRHIILKVLYSPEIELDKQVENTGIGLEAHLDCIIHAQPPPQVLWYKGTTQLGTTERHSAHVRGNRYSFIIRNVSKADFGNYSCVASNSHGKSRAELTLSGTAGAVTFESPNLGNNKFSYNISWSIVSHAPILEYLLLYRPRKHQHHGHHDSHNATKMAIRESWISVSIRLPADRNSRIISPSHPGVVSQTMSYRIESLLPATNYEARVQARNIHGWNKISPIFHFATRSVDMDNAVELSAEPAVYGVSQQESIFSSTVRQFTSTLSILSVLVMKVF